MFEQGATASPLTSRCSSAGLIRQLADPLAAFIVLCRRGSACSPIRVMQQFRSYYWVISINMISVSRTGDMFTRYP